MTNGYVTLLLRVCDRDCLLGRRTVSQRNSMVAIVQVVHGLDGQHDQRVVLRILFGAVQMEYQYTIDQLLSEMINGPKPER